MKKFVITMMALMLVTGAVYASDKPALEKDVLPVAMDTNLIENEPNDDCSIADYLTVGDVYAAAIDPADEEDWFEVFFPAGGEVTFTTQDGDVDPIGDTKMYLYADDCMTQLDYNDDIGYPNFYSSITYTLAPNTTYFVQIIGYASITTGSYILTMTEPAPPCDAPVNNTCDGAIALNLCETFTVDLCGATNDSDPGSGGCTGYSAGGLDVVYMIDLVEDQELTVTGVTSFDNAMYLVTDCSDPVGTCVMGVDATTSGIETLVYDTGNAPGTYYLILDGWASSEAPWEVTVECIVSTEATTFDGIKSMYR